MKRLHRLIVTSATYRMASTPDVLNPRIDPDNNYLWRMSSRRMEAEVVRDNVLYTAGDLDETMGGPDIDHNLGLTSKRRSVYLRLAAEKEPEFLKVFDAPSVTECYERKQTVMPQQALALANSELTQREARNLAAKLDKLAGLDQARFIQEAFLRILARRPTANETQVCLGFLTDQVRLNAAQSKPVTASATDASKIENRKSRIESAALHARENLVLILFNHNDFVTIR